MSLARPTLQVVGRRMDAEHYRLRDFLTRTAQPYEWHEAGSAEGDRASFFDLVFVRAAFIASSLFARPRANTTFA